MSQEDSLERSYLILFRFLMFSKHRVFELGNKYSLTGMQTMMLFLLDKPRPMSAFSKIFSCDASNITGLVDGLEQKKLAGRYEDPKDRRTKMVQLETEGEKIRKDLMRQFTTSNSPLLSKLSPTELQTFIKLLEKITLDEQH